MTTLNDLQYMIEANTQGLNKAFPALEKLTESIDALSKSLANLGKGFDAGMGRVASATQASANKVTKANDQIAASMLKTEASLIRTTVKLDAFKQQIKDAGAPTQLLAVTQKAFNDLQRTLKNTSTTAAEATLAKAKFDRTIAGVTQNLNKHIAAQQAADRATREQAAGVARLNRELEREAKTAEAATAKFTASMQRNQASLIAAEAKAKSLSDAITKVGAGNQLNSQISAAFKDLRTVLESTTATTGEITVAKAKYMAALSAVNNEIKKFQQLQSQSSSATKSTEAALIKQQNVLERTRIRVLDLENALKLQGAKTERIDQLNNAFAEFEKQMTGGALSAKEISEATNKVNAEVAKVKRNEGITDLSSRMTDLAKSAQVALGPLSGVASRITAITSLANRNNIMIAAAVGGVIAFGQAMAKTVMVGANFERQMYKIESILAVTGNRLGMTAAEVDAVAKRVAASTMATSNMARNAAATLMMVRGVSKDIFESALLAAQGLSILTEGNIESQIRRFGRILEDPAQNIEALAESGVVFNAVEKDRIRLLQESGKLDEARQAVMDRLQPVIAAATGETKGLTGAWHELTETFTNFVQQSAMSGGVVSSLTGILNDMNERFKGINENVEAAITLGRAYRLIADSMGWAINRTVIFIDGLIGAFVRLERVMNKIQPPEWLVNLNNFLGKYMKMWMEFSVFDLLNDKLDEMSASGIKAEKDLYQLGHGLQAIQELLPDVAKEGDEWGERLKKSIARAAAELHKAASTGKAPSFDTQIIDEALNHLINGNVDKAAMALDRVFGVADKGDRIVQRLSKDLEEAANIFQKLKDQHLPLIKESENLGAQTTALNDNYEKIKKGMIQYGASAEEATAILERLREEIELNNSSLKNFINNQKIAAEAMKFDVAITKSVGAAKRGLVRDQMVLEALYSSGAISSADYGKSLEQLRNMGFGPLIDEITAATLALEGWTFANQVASMQKGLTDQLTLMREEVRLAGQSEIARASGLDLLRQKQIMLNAGIEEGTQAWNDMLAVVSELSQLQFDKSHAEALRTMQATAASQDAALKSLFYSKETREDMIALANKEYELAQKYGSLMDARAQKELEIFKLLQERATVMREWEEVAEILDNAFKGVEDTIVEMAKTGQFEWRKLVGSILSDILRLNVRRILQPIHDWMGGLLQKAFGGAFAGTLPSIGGSTIPIPLPVTIVGGAGALSAFAPGGSEAATSSAGGFAEMLGIGGGAPAPTVEVGGGAVKAVQTIVEDTVASLGDIGADIGEEVKEALDVGKVFDASEWQVEIAERFKSIMPWDDAATKAGADLFGGGMPSADRFGGLPEYGDILGNKMSAFGSFFESQRLDAALNGIPGVTNGSFGAGFGMPMIDPSRFGGMSSMTQPFMGGGMMDMSSIGGGFQIGGGGLQMASGMGMGGGMEQFTSSLTQATEGLSSFNTGITDTVSQLTESVGGVNTAFESISTSTVPKVTSSLDTLATEGIQQTVQKQVAATASTVQMGTSSTVTSAQIQQLGASASAASTNLAATGGGGGGLLSMFGFDTGGYTGGGNPSGVAGVVHNKEYVFDEEATSRIGVATLENIRREAKAGASLRDFKRGKGTRRGGGGSREAFGSDQSSDKSASLMERLKIINLVDKSMMGDYLATDEGEKAVINILRRNGVRV